MRLLLAIMVEQISLQKPVEAVINMGNAPENAGDGAVPRDTFTDTDTAARVMKRSKRRNESYNQLNMFYGCQESVYFTICLFCKRFLRRLELAMLEGSGRLVNFGVIFASILFQAVRTQLQFGFSNFAFLRL